MGWGVLEARRLGVEQLLLDAGGGYGTELVIYDDWVAAAEAEAAPVPLAISSPRPVDSSSRPPASVAGTGARYVSPRHGRGRRLSAARLCLREGGERRRCAGRSLCDPEGCVVHIVPMKHERLP
jgi:hypothetical protein